MYAPINHHIALEVEHDIARSAQERDFESQATATATAAVQPAEPWLAIRVSRSADASTLQRLGRLDGDGFAAARLAALADGGALLADVDGEIVAAVALSGGELAADPFRPTAEVAALLRLRASQLAADNRPRRSHVPSLLRARVH